MAETVLTVLKTALASACMTAATVAEAAEAVEFQSAHNRAVIPILERSLQPQVPVALRA